LSGHADDGLARVRRVELDLERGAGRWTEVVRNDADEPTRAAIELVFHLARRPARILHEAARELQPGALPAEARGLVALPAGASGLGALLALAGPGGAVRPDVRLERTQLTVTFALLVPARASAAVCVTLAPQRDLPLDLDPARA